MRILLAEDDRTIADGLIRSLKKAGYATGVIGKWHLGLGDAPAPDWNGRLVPGPLEIGFDYCFLLPTTNDRVPSVYVENHRVRNLDPLVGRIDFVAAQQASHVVARVMHACHDNRQSGLCLISGIGMAIVWPIRVGRGRTLKTVQSASHFWRWIPVVTLTRLDSTQPDFKACLARLLQFDDAADAAIEQTVAGILHDVKKRGDAAVLEYTERFDRLPADSLASLELTTAQWFNIAKENPFQPNAPSIKTLPMLIN